GRRPTRDGSGGHLRRRRAAHPRRRLLASEDTFRPPSVDPLGFRDKNGRAPSPPHGTTLSVFDGRDPNGTWELYVLDPSSGAAGAITEGVDARLRARGCRPAEGGDGRWAGDGTRRGRRPGRERVLERRDDPDPVGRLGDAVPLDGRGPETRGGGHGRGGPGGG